MNVIYGSAGDDIATAIGEWFAKKTGTEVHQPFTAMGWGTESELFGVVLFNDFNGSNIEMHVWVPDHRMTRQMMRDVYEYVFVRAKCNRLTIKPYRKNKAARKAAEKAGFVFEAVLRDYYGLGRGNDALVYRLDRMKAESWL